MPRNIKVTVLFFLQRRKVCSSCRHTHLLGTKVRVISLHDKTNHDKKSQSQEKTSAGDNTTTGKKGKKEEMEVQVRRRMGVRANTRRDTSTRVRDTKYIQIPFLSLITSHTQ